MKAIKIDVTKKQIYEVELQTANGSQLKSIYQHLECGCFCQALRLQTNDILFVDDNGLLKDPETVPGFFRINGQRQTLVGHGLLVGHYGNGEARDVQVTVEEISKHVGFQNEFS